MKECGHVRKMLSYFCESTTWWQVWSLVMALLWYKMRKKSVNSRRFHERIGCCRCGSSGSSGWRCWGRRIFYSAEHFQNTDNICVMCNVCRGSTFSSLCLICTINQQKLHNINMSCTSSIMKGCFSSPNNTKFFVINHTFSKQNKSSHIESDCSRKFTLLLCQHQRDFARECPQRQYYLVMLPIKWRAFSFHFFQQRTGLTISCIHFWYCYNLDTWY